MEQRALGKSVPDQVGVSEDESVPRFAVLRAKELKLPLAGLPYSIPLYLRYAS